MPSAIWQIFYELLIFWDLSTEIEVTTGDRWEPLVTEKKTVRNILIIEKKSDRNEHEMKERHLIRKP